MTTGISSSFANGLGPIAHGPCILSTGPGLGIGLRCAFAYLDGLLLSLEVKAVGQAALDANEARVHLGSRGGGRYVPRLPPSSPHLSVPASAAGLRPDGELWLRLEAHHDSRYYTIRGGGGDNPGSPVYVQDLDLWWPKLPEDARLPLEAGWPELGAPMTTTVLALENLDQLANQEVRLG